ncbi:MAG: hypothetical protein V3S21_09800 [Xanthomonadales bacterium]
MTQRLFSLIVLVVCITTATAAFGKELVREFTGSRSTETVEFEVRAPWLLDWWVNGEYPQMLTLEVSLIDARTGQHAGYILKIKRRGNGVRLFDQGGRYRLKIDAVMSNWILKVEQLSRNEAKQYTPVEKTAL